MDKEEELILRACEKLEKVKKWKWRNNSALADELKVDEGLLRKTLIGESLKPERRIRYHPLPSRKRMDILWGLANVSIAESAPSLFRSDNPDIQILNPIDTSDPFIFLSHNHRDFKTIHYIQDILAKSNLKCWLFETDIEFNALIIPKVRDALQYCKGLLVFISMNSIGSLWVQKEFGFILDEIGKASIVVIDGNDKKLIDCIQPEEFHSKYHQFDKYLDTKVKQLNIQKADEWRQIAHEFMRQISDYIRKDRLVSVYPDIQAVNIPYIKPSSAIKEWAQSLVN